MAPMILKKIWIGTICIGLNLIGNAATAQTFQPGMVVTSCYDPTNGGDPAIAIENLQHPLNSGGELGKPWNHSSNSNFQSGATPNRAPMPVNGTWDQSEVGQVFGIAIGGHSAPGVSPDIFTSSTNVYRGGGDGRYDIFRLNPDKALTLGTYEVFFGVSSTGAPNSLSSSLGQIAYNQSNSVLYVSNFDDGFIYTISDTGSGLGIQTDGFDHGNSRAFDSSAALANLPDDTSQGTTIMGRHIWAVQFNPVERRLYYAVHDAQFLNSVWSVGVDAAGVPVPSTILREFIRPTLPPHFTATLPDKFISDIAFSFDGQSMILSERYQHDGGNPAHATRVLHYEGSSGSWVPKSSNDRQIIGGHLTGNNSAGGVDFSYDYLADGSDIDLSKPEGRIVATGDALEYLPTSYVYGIQSTAISQALALLWNANDHYFIDFNDAMFNKLDIGDVEAYRVAPPVPWNCATVNASAICTESSLGGPNTHTVSLEITHDMLGSNSSNLPITDITITTDDGTVYPGLFTSNMFTPALPLTWGNTTSANFDVQTSPGDEEICLTVELNKADPDALMTPMNSFCCTEVICFDVPKCEGCLELENDYLVSYSYDNNLISIEGTICSDDISPSDLSIEVDGSSMNIINVTPISGGNCLAFEAEFTGPNVPVDDGLDTLFTFYTSSDQNNQGVSQCCQDTLLIEYLSESDNIDNLDNNDTVIFWDWDDIDWEVIEWDVIDWGILNTDNLSRIKTDDFKSYLIRQGLIPQSAKVIVMDSDITVLSKDNLVRKKFRISSIATWQANSRSRAK